MIISGTEQDFTTTVKKALTEIDPNWENYNGIIVVGSHSNDLIEQKIQLLKEGRENNIPTLGICHGMQLMAVEFARNVLGIPDATSEEFGTGTNLVTKMPGFRVGLKEVPWFGTLLQGNTLESHWHQYKVNPLYWGSFNRSGWFFGVNVNDEVAETMVLTGHPFYMGTQFHPEYQNSVDKPHIVLTEFLKAFKSK